MALHELVAEALKGRDREAIANDLGVTTKTLRRWAGDPDASKDYNSIPADKIDELCDLLKLDGVTRARMIAARADAARGGAA